VLAAVPRLDVRHKGRLLGRTPQLCMRVISWVASAYCPPLANRST
jgi:hypothetical protein